MPKAPKNWRNVGYLLPEVIDPDDNLCICVPIPKEWGHIRAFLGQLTELAKWQAWQPDGATGGRDAARRWFDIATCVAEEIDCAMANNCGCNSNEPILYRYSPDTGRMEQSTDGGETWTDAPDARYDSPLLPPHDGDTVDDIKCLTAANAVEYFKTQLIDQATSWTTLAQVVAGVIAIVVALLTGGLGAALAVELASIFIQAGIAAAAAAFTTDVYTRFECNLYCNSALDGSWDSDAIAAIRVQLNIDETATALSILQSWLDQLGPAGLTNSGRLHLVAEADCTDCDCPEECNDPGLIVFGTVTDVAIYDGHPGMEVEAVFEGGGYVVRWGQIDQTVPPNQCCYHFEVVVLEGSINSSYWTDCDGVGHGSPAPAGHNLGHFDYYFLAPAKIRILFGA